TFWPENTWRNFGFGLVILVETGLIILLLIGRAKRRQVKLESERLALLEKDERQLLEGVISNVPGVVWESRVELGLNKRKIKFVSDYVQKMLGYSVEEWLADPNFSLAIMHEEDRERASSEADAIFRSGEHGILKFRWLARDGRVLWVESRLS